MRFPILTERLGLPESDSDHMHRCAMCAMLLSQPADPRDDYTVAGAEKFHPDKVDKVKLLRMAVTHDLCEVAFPRAACDVRMSEADSDAGHAVARHWLAISRRFVTPAR